MAGHRRAHPAPTGSRPHRRSASALGSTPATRPAHPGPGPARVSPPPREDHPSGPHAETHPPRPGTPTRQPQPTTRTAPPSRETHRTGHHGIHDDRGSRLNVKLSAREFAREVTLLAQSRPTPAGLSVRDVVGFGRHPLRGRWREGDAGGPAAIAHAMAL